jgi:hypothetical protein
MTPLFLHYRPGTSRGNALVFQPTVLVAFCKTLVGIFQKAIEQVGMETRRFRSEERPKGEDVQAVANLKVLGYLIGFRRRNVHGSSRSKNGDSSVWKLWMTI